MRTSTVVALTWLAAGLGAQSFTVTPAHLATTEGAGASAWFGCYQNMRLQWGDGELPNKVLILKGLGFRLNDKYLNPGRQFTNLRVELAPTDYTKMTAVFTANALATPTLVHTGAFALPTLTGSNPGPSPWDGRLAIPFARSFVHLGTRDLLIDATLNGGRLANSAPWSHTYYGYYFDAPRTESYKWGRVTKHYGSPGCKDRGNPLNAIADTTLDTYVLGSPSHNPNVRTNLGIWGQSYWTGPNTVVAHALSTRFIPGGVALPGVTCNRLFLDLSKPFFLDLHRSDRSGRSWRLLPVGGTLYIQWQAAWAGLKLYWQAAWADTKDGRLKLTHASENYIPSLQYPPRRTSVFTYKAPWGYGYGPYSHADYAPVIRYAH